MSQRLKCQVVFVKKIQKMVEICKNPSKAPKALLQKIVAGGAKKTVQYLTAGALLLYNIT